MYTISFYRMFNDAKPEFEVTIPADTLNIDEAAKQILKSRQLNPFLFTWKAKPKTTFYPISLN